MKKTSMGKSNTIISTGITSAPPPQYVEKKDFDKAVRMLNRRIDLLSEIIAIDSKTIASLVKLSYNL